MSQQEDFSREEFPGTYSTLSIYYNIPSVPEKCNTSLKICEIQVTDSREASHGTEGVSNKPADEPSIDLMSKCISSHCPCTTKFKKVESNTIITFYFHFSFRISYFVNSKIIFQKFCYNLM